MVVLTKQAIDQFTITRSNKPNSTNDMTVVPRIPIIDLSKPDSKSQIVKACEDFGFFKVINHGVPMDFITRLESEAVKFFSLPLSEKESVGSPYPLGFGYGNKRIGLNGDVGWVEYLLMTTNSYFEAGENPENFRCAVKEYISAVKGMACKVVELMADGLRIQPRNVFSRLLMDEQSDSLFRLNHYPPCPEFQAFQDRDMVGFGEHTDPQIISVLRSNNISGLEISLRDGRWVPVPPDHTSFFINVGDSLQVMTNGRFKSVRHRVIANSCKSRISMIYFGAPPMSEKIAPLPSLMGIDQTSLYKEFTWYEYKANSRKSRLADNRLVPFEKIAAS